MLSSSSLFKTVTKCLLQRSNGKLMPHNLSRQGHGQHYMMQPSSFSKNFFSTAEVYDDENDWEEDTASLAFVSEDAQGKNTSKRAKIRLYRMLLRQCETLVDPSKDDTEHIMLQPMVVSTPSRYVKTGPPVVTKPMDIYKLFYALMEHENKLLGTNNEKQNDYTYESPTYGKNPQERQKIDASIDDWFFEVSGGIIPSFPNDDNDDNYRSLLTKSCWTTKKQLQKVLKYAFKTHYTRVDSYTLLQLAIRATKILREQQSMWEKSTVATTDGVRVIATSRHVGQTKVRNVQTKAIHDIHRFSYRIRIENLSPHHIQLLGRHAQIQELEDCGTKEKHSLTEEMEVTQVGGLANVLRPGQCFEFMSDTDLSSKIGRIQGHFSMTKILPESAETGAATDALPLGDKMRVDFAPFALTSE